MGRSTAAASFAIQRARLSERVVVIDLDLDAPGIGTLLAGDQRGTTAQWGIVDYLLERPIQKLDLRQYYHACRRGTITGEGEILVFPSGQVNSGYLGKLARIDYEPGPSSGIQLWVRTLLEEIRQELNPHWILLDARAGLSEPAGLLLGGIAHLHVLFGTTSEHSWQGVRLVLEHLGAERVRKDKPQLECVLVQAMVPQDTSVASAVRASFSERCRDEFRDHYYAESDAEEVDRFWDVRDLETSDAPHVPLALSYQPRLAHFDRIEDVADTLSSEPEYQALAERIVERFRASED